MIQNLTTKHQKNLKPWLKKPTKDIMASRVFARLLKFKDGKVIHTMVIDMTVVNLDEMKKAMPNEYSGAGKRVSFSKTKKMLEDLGYTEKTN